MPISFNQHNSIQNNSVSFKKSISSYSFDIPFSSEPVEEIRLFLDMDGVLTDFTDACEKLGDNMMLWYSSDRELFWKKITSAGIEFWSEMSWMPGGRELHGFLNNLGLCPTILSALPGPERKKALKNAREGKIKWLRKELGPSYAETAILCYRSEKALQSGVSRVLIDDNSENIREWEEAGGIGILHKNSSRTIRCFSKIFEVEQKF
jgi:5'' nucleotidase, deoxy (Pyrimidine), cytosolic type C protein (NT5C).